MCNHNILIDFLNHKRGSKHSCFPPLSLCNTKKLRYLPAIPKMEKFTVFTINFLTISGDVRRKDFFATTIWFKRWFLFVHNVLQLLCSKSKTADFLRNLTCLTILSSQALLFKSCLNLVRLYLVGESINLLYFNSI